jgi:DNA-binding transcriptional regulator YdaS (Cro superfamily)
MTIRDRDQGLRLALAAMDSAAELARQLQIKPQSLNKWGRVPADRCLDVERITGVSRHLLRPDIYGPERPLVRGGAKAAA